MTVQFDGSHPLAKKEVFRLAKEVFRLAKLPDEASRARLGELLLEAGLDPAEFVVPDQGGIPATGEVLLQTAEGAGGVVVRYEVLDRHKLLFRRALHPDLCAELIELAELECEWRQGTQESSLARQYTDSARTCSSAWGRGPAWQRWGRILRTLVYEAGRFLLVWNKFAYWTTDSGFEILRYEPGQEFQPHVDRASGGGGSTRRQVSFLIFLNDDFEGGETSFPMGGELDSAGRPLGRLVKPEQGSILLFSPCWTEPHSALPPTAGTKYAVVGWLYP